MPFGVVSGVDRGMGVLDKDGYRRTERGSFGGKHGASHCNQWGLRSVCESDALFPNYSGKDLLDRVQCVFNNLTLRCRRSCVAWLPASASLAPAFRRSWQT